MPTVVLASSLARWLTPSPTAAGERRLAVAGATVADVLTQLFTQFPHLRGYVTDEAGAIRHHVVIFVNDTAVDKAALSDAVPPDAEISIFQALSGG